MTQICPKCSYLRKETDTCPAWQCPACQVAYTKASDSKNTGSTQRPSSVTLLTKRSISASTWKWLVLFLVIAVLALANKPTSRQSLRQDTGSPTAMQQPQIILYGTSWCGYCAKARAFFKANGIQYTELDIEKTNEGHEGHKKLGGGGVPLIVVGDVVMHGYNEAGLRQALAPWMQGN